MLAQVRSRIALGRAGTPWAAGVDERHVVRLRFFETVPDRAVEAWIARVPGQHLEQRVDYLVCHGERGAHDLIFHTPDGNGWRWNDQGPTDTSQHLHVSVLRERVKIRSFGQR